MIQIIKTCGKDEKLIDVSRLHVRNYCEHFLVTNMWQGPCVSFETIKITSPVDRATL